MTKTHIDKKVMKSHILNIYSHCDLVLMGLSRQVLIDTLIKTQPKIAKPSVNIFTYVNYIQ